jgi:signal peptidase I
MKEKEKEIEKVSPSLITRFRESDNKIIAILREILWVVAVVGGIALALFLISGTWPAVVTIESTSMVPHMNVGDLVFVAQADRFGPLQTWTDGKQSGYMKFGDYGDVIIYNPNGGTQSFIPFLGGVHPIIHRAMTWQDAGPIEVYVNPAGGNHSPTSYIPITKANYSATGSIIPSSNPDIGYIINISRNSTHGGYITKGDNNQISDEGSGLAHYANLGPIEPVEPQWVVGKALFTIPLLGYLPLNIVPVAIVIILIIVLHEWYMSRKEGEENASKKGRKKEKNRK